jgi:glycosyltransferase involved in cell wall biosynthesis
VVLPSEWYENAPLSLMESYALGKPAIAARIGGMPELIREEQTGLTFTPGSVHELADVLRRFANPRDLRIEEMGHEGRVWMKAEYTPEHYRERILNLYRELTR